MNNHILSPVVLESCLVYRSMTQDFGIRWGVGVGVGVRLFHQRQPYATSSTPTETTELWAEIACPTQEHAKHFPTAAFCHDCRMSCLFRISLWSHDGARFLRIPTQLRLTHTGPLKVISTDNF